MEARLFHAVILTATLASFGASSRTTNFVVKAPTAEFARTLAERAEQYRRDLAIEWLGQELPRWPEPCPITAYVGPQIGAGGATSFAFHQGRPFGWVMNVQGSQERILDSVLPHEITHTIFATHFGRPLPRWADEGACTTVEHVSERAKQHHLLLRFLTTGRGIAFNRMYAMKEYPRDVLPLYAQGYSLARYLIAQRGKRTFVAYIGEGMRGNDWGSATRNHYGFRDLSELQVSWLAWVKEGSSETQARVMLASRLGATPAGGKPESSALASNQKQDSPRRAPSADQPQKRPDGGDVVQLASLSQPLQPQRDADQLPPPKPNGEQREAVSWYIRQKDHAKNAKTRGAQTIPPDHASAQTTTNGPARTMSRPQTIQRAQERILEWGPSASVPYR